MRILRGALLTVVLLGAGIGGTAMAMLVGQTAGAATASSPSVLVGDTSIEPTASAVTSGVARAWQFKASATGTSATESLYVADSTNAATRVVLGLYSDAGGAPGALLGSGTGTVTSDAWNTVTLTDVPVVAGQEYWLAILGISGQIGYQQRYGGCHTVASSQGDMTELPATWTSATSGAYTDCASVYVAGATDAGSGTSPSSTPTTPTSTTPSTSDTSTTSTTPTESTSTTTTESTSTTPTETSSTTSTETSTTPTTTSTTTSTPTTSTTTTTTTSTSGGKLQSAGWWPAWEQNAQMSGIPWNALTQIIMFSDTSMASAPWLNTNIHGVTPSNQQQLVSLAHQHGDTAILSIGGSDDETWSTACNSTNRAAFITAAIGQMQQYGYDGVELDIEEGPWIGTSDFNACVQTFNAMLKATTTQAGKAPLLTLDVDPTWAAAYIPPVAPYVDQINLMDYTSTCANNCAAVARSIAAFTSLGIPASKLLDGIGLDPGMPDNNNPSDCGAKAQYLSTQPIAGIAEWSIQDDYPSYSCFAAMAPYIG